MTSKNQIMTIYTDGACSNNGKSKSAGGIGIHFPYGELSDVSKVFREGSCTNQRTELYAILFAIKLINKEIGLKNLHLIIKSDSIYSINCATKWVKKWVTNGWKNNAGEMVSNKEMIEKIYEYVKKYNISFEHVSAHTGMDDDDSVGNDKADRLAVKARDRANQELKNGTTVTNVPNVSKISKISNKSSVTKISNTKNKNYSNTKNKNYSNTNKKSMNRYTPSQKNNYMNKKLTSPAEIVVELIKSKK